MKQAVEWEAYTVMLSSLTKSHVLPTAMGTSSTAGLPSLVTRLQWKPGGPPTAREVKQAPTEQQTCTMQGMHGTARVLLLKTSRF